MSEYIEALKKFFKKDKFVENAGIKIVSVDEKSAVIAADIDEKHLNANGCVQGGMLYTIADFAFAVLGNYLHPSTVTQTGQISYLRPAFAKRLIATAVEVERAGRTSVSDVTVRGENGETFCICRFNGFVKEVDKQAFIDKAKEL